MLYSGRGDIMEIEIKRVYSAVLSNGISVRGTDLKRVYYKALRLVRWYYGYQLDYMLGHADIKYVELQTLYEGNTRISGKCLDLRDVCRISCASVNRYTFMSIWTPERRCK